ncbi:MAG: hypothetical protein MHM6MM_008614 [Cercozoa sp. M6MM]
MSSGESEQEDRVPELRTDSKAKKAQDDFAVKLKRRDSLTSHVRKQRTEKMRTQRSGVTRSLSSTQLSSPKKSLTPKSYPESPDVQFVARVKRSDTLSKLRRSDAEEIERFALGGASNEFEAIHEESDELESVDIETESADNEPVDRPLFVRPAPVDPGPTILNHSPRYRRYGQTQVEEVPVSPQFKLDEELAELETPKSTRRLTLPASGAGESKQQARSLSGHRSSRRSASEVAGQRFFP